MKCFFFFLLLPPSWLAPPPLTPSVLQRAGSIMLSSAPLPPPGAVLADAGDFLDAHQRKAAVAPNATSKTVVTARSGGRNRAPGMDSKHHRDVLGGDGSGFAASVLRADDDAPLDLMDATLTRSIVEGDDPLKLLARDRQRLRLMESEAAGAMLAAGITIAKDGRMVIPDDAVPLVAGVMSMTKQQDDPDDDGDADIVRGKAAALREMLPRTHAARLGRDKRGRRILPDSEEPGGSSSPAASMPNVGKSWGGRKLAGGSRQETQASRFSGAQYRSKPGSAGDSRRPDAKFEPFAYVPLDPRSISGSAGQKSIGRFDAVSASTSRSSRADRKQDSNLREAPGRSALGKRRR
jgi:hypothetical protein